jgi:hypothetical protein
VCVGLHAQRVLAAHRMLLRGRPQEGAVRVTAHLADEADGSSAVDRHLQAPSADPPLQDQRGLPTAALEALQERSQLERRRRW